MKKYEKNLFFCWKKKKKKNQNKMPKKLSEAMAMLAVTSSANNHLLQTEYYPSAEAGSVDIAGAFHVFLRYL